MKKFLSLVLALVMTMSLVTISAGAKDFTDAEAITYDEAVAVMSAVKVIDGYTDDSFKPTATLTRGAAAKIICNMILGPTTAAELPTAVAPFKDVPANSTFAGYIAYCAKEGIIGGYADGTFKPGNTLTGYAFMKMLLGALGYDAETEGYNTPGTWSISVAKQAIGIGLDKGLTADFDGTKPVTREEACLYAFNTLKATLVEYTQKTTVNVGGAEVVLQGAAKEVSWGTATNNDGNIGGKKDNHVQFAEKYFPKLVQKDAVDAFGRPSWTWVNDKKEIDTFVDYTTLVAEYSEKVTGKDLYELISKSVLDDCNVYVYIDGVVEKANLGSAYFTKGNIVKTNTEGVGATGNGVLTQVFVDTAADEIVIAIINTYLAKAAEDYDEKNEDVDLTVYNIDNKNTVKAPIYVKDGAEDETMKVSADDFAIEDVKEDDLFLVQIADGEIQTMEPAEVLSEKTITNFKLDKYVTADGEKYDQADTARYDVEVLDQYDDKNMKELTYNVILDKYGYLIGLELNSDPDQYVFVTGFDGNYSHLSTKTADAAVIFLDGTMKVVEVKVNKSSQSLFENYALGAWTAKTDVQAAQVNRWCTYTVDKDGVYTLKEVPATTAASKIAQSQKDVTLGGSVTIDKKHVSLDGSGSFAKVYGNDDTVYLNVELKNVNVAPGTKAYIIDDVESVTTGIKNVKISVKNVAGANAPAEEIYTLYKNNGYVIAAVTIGENEGISTNYAYITSATGVKGVNKEAYASATDEWTWTREAVVNGKIVELTEVGDTLDTLDTMVQGKWYEVKYDANGNVRDASPITFVDDNSTRFVDNVGDIETAVTTYDTVVLFAEEESGAPKAVTKLTYKNGTLYTNVALTEGFSVSPEVNVVLSLGELKKDSTVAEFDSVKDDYTGYAGLEKAIRNLDANFKGDVSAILEGGVAKTIILNDTTGTSVNTGADTTTGLFSSVVDANADNNDALKLSTASVSGSDELTMTIVDGENVAIQMKDALTYLGYKVGDISKSAGKYTAKTVSPEGIATNVTFDTTNVAQCKKIYKVTVDGELIGYQNSTDSLTVNMTSAGLKGTGSGYKLDGTYRTYDTVSLNQDKARVIVTGFVEVTVGSGSYTWKINGDAVSAGSITVVKAGSKVEGSVVSGAQTPADGKGYAFTAGAVVKITKSYVGSDNLEAEVVGNKLTFTNGKNYAAGEATFTWTANATGTFGINWE